MGETWIPGMPKTTGWYRIILKNGQMTVMEGYMEDYYYLTFTEKSSNVTHHLPIYFPEKPQE